MDCHLFIKWCCLKVWGDWGRAEQIEEEALARTILDKLKLIGDDKGGLYLFDRDILNIEIVENN